jgi:hypothetical protein
MGFKIYSENWRNKMSKKVSIFEPEKGKKTRKGTKPNTPAKPRVPGSGRNRPAKGYDPETKTWNQG